MQEVVISRYRRFRQKVRFQKRWKEKKLSLSVHRLEREKLLYLRKSIRPWGSLLPQKTNQKKQNNPEGSFLNGFSFQCLAPDARFLPSPFKKLPSGCIAKVDLPSEIEA
jgi:hypothetical protein